MTGAAAAVAAAVAAAIRASSPRSCHYVLLTYLKLRAIFYVTMV